MSRNRPSPLLVLAVVAVVLTTGCVGTVLENDRGGGASLHVDSAADPPADAAVVDCESLSADQRAVFERAAPDGHTEFDGVDTEPFVDHGYVRCDGDLYRVAVAVP